MEQTRIKIPRYFTPWPYQADAWNRMESGRYNYYFKNWARQLGKDTTDIQNSLWGAWNNPGSQTVYVGLDNVWINENIFKKVLDDPPHRHWDEYPEDRIQVKDTQKEILMLNNPQGIAEARVKFIGFLNDQQLIGSSYDRFYISEASLYKEKAFAFIQPIWDRKLAMGKDLLVNFNGTPRGMRNVYWDLMRVYTGCDEEEAMPGEHITKYGRCYVDRVRIQDAMIPDGHGGFKRLYTDEMIDQLKARYYREYGNLNLYEQENECSFKTVNAGLVYLGIQQLIDEGRFRRFNLDTSKPVYVAFDIGSKAKMTDATAGVIYQYINGFIFIYDIFEARGMALTECVAELSKKPYFHLIRMGILPWDSERSASSETPIEEVTRQFPNIKWHALDKERVDRGIALVRKQLPNMMINEQNCDWLLECFLNYEYKRLDAADDWSAKPKHTKHSHLMDAVRYACMGLQEIKYFNLNADGRDPESPDYYGGDDEPEYARWASLPVAYRTKQPPKDSRGESYGGWQ